MKVFDSNGSKISDSLFAEAYRATVPVLADAKHVTIRMHSNRASELSQVAGDISDIVEIGEVTETRLDGSTKTLVRVIAAPVTVHVKDGAELILDDKADPTVISFQVNGIPEVQIINVAITSAEMKAKQAAGAKAKADADAANNALRDKELEAAKLTAFEEGRKQAILDQAKAAGAASVQQSTGKPS
jgi:hypothetical protein